MKLLFVCSQNQLRSPTAEALFANYPEFQTDSAGIDPGAEIPLTHGAIQWADMIFVMEQIHQQKLSEQFAPWLNHQRVVCLNIPDEYDYMDPALVNLLKQRVLPLLRNPNPVDSFAGEGHKS